MPAEKPTVAFVFPPGHPLHGKTVRRGNFHFVDGACRIPADAKEKVARTLTRYYGAAEEGTDAYKAIAAQYAPPAPSADGLLDQLAAAEAEAKAKAEADAAAAAGKGKK